MSLLIKKQHSLAPKRGQLGSFIMQIEDDVIETLGRQLGLNNSIPEDHIGGIGLIGNQNKKLANPLPLRPQKGSANAADMSIMQEITAKNSTAKEIFEDANKDDYDSDDLQIVDVIESESSSAMKQKRLRDLIIWGNF